MSYDEWAICVCGHLNEQHEPECDERDCPCVHFELAEDDDD